MNSTLKIFSQNRKSLTRKFVDTFINITYSLINQFINDFSKDLQRWEFLVNILVRVEQIIEYFVRLDSLLFTYRIGVL